MYPKLRHLVCDIYYCFIPLVCRNCYYLSECRGSWFERRKCKNGCIKLNILRKRKYEQDREDKLNALVKDFKERERR